MEDRSDSRLDYIEYLKDDGLNWYRHQIGDIDRYNRDEFARQLTERKSKSFDSLSKETKSYLQTKYGDMVGKQRWTCVGSRMCFQVDVPDGQELCGCCANSEKMPRGRICPQYLRLDLKSLSKAVGPELYTSLWNEGDPLYMFFISGKIYYVQY